MSLYADYIKEREGLETLETFRGFITYKFRADGCYLQDIYVTPEWRKHGVAARMADELAILAKSKGLNMLIGSVDSRAPSAEASDKVLRAYGMRAYTAEGPVTYYCKELL